ncbi:MAG TPA: MFS transporter [Solirubrobacteraceae bacterium]|nr:MFS transporter [Solirubrobacteraceae bacterium]
MSTLAPTVPVENAGGPQRDKRLGWLLAVCCAAQFMVILDLSIVNVALPSIQFSLGFNAPELQWVVDAYAISFAGFLMFGGRAADHFGQRRVFVLALLLFGLASLAGGLAADRTMLVFARAAQGIGGALMAACSLAIITSSFSPGPQLNRAIGIWATMNGLGGAAGMLFGGIITEALSWRWVLLINPPIAVAAALVAYAVVSERRRERPGSFDVAGALTLTVGQLVLVYGIVEAGLSGLGTAIALGPIFAGIALLVVFVLIETRFASEPLIPFKELTRPLRVANNIVLLFSASLFPMWFVSSLYLQQVLGLSPLSTGLIFLPMTLMIMLVAGRAGKLVGRFGVQPVLGGGLVMLSAGMFLLARIGASGSGIVYVMIPGLLTAAGIAMSIVPSTIAATQGAKPGQTGLASGLVNTSRQIGGGLGLAILVTLATERSTHLIGKGVQVPQALTEGFRLAYLIGGGLAAAAALMTLIAMKRPAGLPSARRFGAAIGVLVVGFIAIDVAFANSQSAPVGAYTTKGAYSFVSAPNLHPPIIRHTPDRHTSGTPAPGYILTANFYNLSYPPIIGQSGPLILDSQLQPVWFEPVPEKVVASNLATQSYEGKPVLNWWQGLVTNTGQTESGEDVVVDQHYRPIARLKGADGWVLTLHEFLISGEDAWVTANKNLALDLSNYGGAYNGALIDSAVQEYNLKTGKLLRTWDALDHISLADSYATLPTNGFPWDAYHVNSIQLVGNGSLLVSMRNTWAAYLVDAASGKILWTLGGKRSDYRFGPGAAFQWQHDVAFEPGQTPAGPTTGAASASSSPDLLMSMYDDHCCQITSGGKNVPATGPSRALVLRIDQQRRTATLAAQFVREREFAADYMGDAQPLPSGGAFVGWGSEPYFSEYGRSGQLLLDGEFPWPDVSYRATLAHWVGLPLTKPSGAARRTGAKTVVYASWNGATRLSSWRLLAGSNAGRLTAVTSTAKFGFETAIVVPRPPRTSVYTRFELQALDSAGHPIGSSQPFSVSAE